MSQLHDRIIEIATKLHLSHVGSALTSCDIIEMIYVLKREDEPFILSCGHSALSLYVVLEKHFGLTAEVMYKQHGVHPERCNHCHIDCSTGSLGMGISIALGMALADRTKNVYCLISDGELSEGSVYETANAMRKYDVTNLKVYLNYNGWSAYDSVPQWMIDNIIRLMPSIEVWHTSVERFGLSGLSAHYVTL